MEKDVARKRQLLDIVILRAVAGGPPLVEPCDGLEQLRAHNLMTYKSGREALDVWALEELIGHYVNYRKSFAPKTPTTDFGLYAVATRHPTALMREVKLQPVKAGIYTLKPLSQPITVIVLKEIAPVTRNALWALFSFEEERVAQGAQEYVWRQPDHASVLSELCHLYQQQGIAMSYTYEDFYRDLARKMLVQLPPEERLRGLPPEERLRGLSEAELQQIQQLLAGKLKH